MTKKKKEIQKFRKEEGKHLPSCRTTRNETRKGTRQKNNFSCRQRISNCWEDCLLASDECGLPAPSPSQVDTWRSPCNLPRQNPGTPCARSIRILKNYKNLSIYRHNRGDDIRYDTREKECKFLVYSFSSWIYRTEDTMEDTSMLVENITTLSIKNKKRNLLSQCMDRLSSSRLRQTLQNFLLWCTCSDQQCATGFCVQQNKTSFISHFFFSLSLFRSHRNALYSMKKKPRERKYPPFTTFFLPFLWKVIIGGKKKLKEKSKVEWF